MYCIYRFNDIRWIELKVRYYRSPSSLLVNFIGVMRLRSTFMTSTSSFTYRKHHSRLAMQTLVPPASISSFLKFLSSVGLQPLSREPLRIRITSILNLFHLVRLHCFPSISCYPQEESCQER